MRAPIPSDECVRACEWASLRLDGQLSEFEGVLLDAHLARCAHCRAFATSITGLTEMLRAAPLEQPAFAVELPHKRRGRRVVLRAVSAAAAVAVVGLSGLVSLQLSASRTRPGSAAIERKVIDLKERQMDQLAPVAAKAPPAVRQGVAAAELVTVGTAPKALGAPAPREIPVE